MVTETMTLSPEADVRAEQLAAELGITKGDVFAWGLTLLDLAVEAEKEGKSIGVIEPDGRVERVFDLLGRDGG